MFLTFLNIHMYNVHVLKIGVDNAISSDWLYNDLKFIELLNKSSD